MTDSTFNTITTAWQEPDIPSKWDIIPVHNSDRGNFKRCKRYWDWASPARNNLSIRADLYGVNTDLWYGTGIHWSLEQYYNPFLQHDPVESWKTWFDIQWRGGIVTEEWLDLVYDLKPKPIEVEVPQSYADYADSHPESTKTDLWQVKGLMDIIPDADHFEFDELFEMGVEMMTFYKKYAAKHDDFIVLTTEHTFSVPIWDYENECMLKMIDTREDSPNHGKVLEVHSRGKIDGMVRRVSDGKLCLKDHKTAISIGEQYFEKLETDEQITNYMWAAEVEAKYYGLPHAGEIVDEFIYNTLRKAYPRQPTQLQSGMFSVDREKESTTYEILMPWIARNMPGVKLSEKQQNYVDWLRDLGDEQFIIRKIERRNRHQIANCGRRIFEEAMDMLDPHVRTYPNLRNDYSCLKCQFRPPCIAKESGADWKQMINDNYTTNRDR